MIGKTNQTPEFQESKSTKIFGTSLKTLFQLLLTSLEIVIVTTLLIKSKHWSPTWHWYRQPAGGKHDTKIHQVFLGLLCSKSEDVHINVNLEHGRWRWKGWPTRTLKTLGVYNGWWSSQLGPTKLRWKPKNTQSPQQTSHSICHDQFHLALAINPMFVYNICPGKNI